jgi:iron complex transport system ATP-binding protein
MSLALCFDKVSAGYPHRPVLHAVEAKFHAGKIVGIVGPNGAGKTTLLRAALGLLPFTGRIEILGQSAFSMPRAERARAIAYLPQGADAHWPVTAEHLVSLGRLPHRALFAPLSEKDRKIVADVLIRCDAAQFAARRMDELSAGERARILFARALATEAPILLADEPAAFLDPAHQLRLMALLRAEAGRGTAIGVTLHDLSLASRHCDEILLLNNGRVIGQGRPPAILTDENLASVFGIRATRLPDGAVLATALI